MYQIPRLLTAIVCLFLSHFCVAQTSGWDQLNKKLAGLTTDSARVQAYYQVAAEIYRSTAQEAKEIVDKGLLLADQKHLDDLEIELLNLRGVIDLKLNNTEESVRTHFKVLKLREQKNDSKGVMLSFINIGNVFNKSYDPNQALVYYQKALALAKEIKDTRNRANVSTSIGNIYAQKALNEGKQSDVQTAIRFITETVDFCKKNAPDVELYNSYILLSYLHLKADNIAKSRHYTDLAIAITEKKKDPIGISYARINRANIYVKQQQFDLAEKEVAYIKNTITKSGLDYVRDELQGDFDKIAAAVKEKNKALMLSDQDSTTKQFYADAEAQRLQVREELREKYETEKKELENKNLRLEQEVMTREANRIKILWAVTIGILLTFLIMLLLLNHKNKQLREEKFKVLQQAQEIKEQHTELIQADRFRSRIFSVVSHDLRIPLSNFQSLLALSKLVELPPEQIKNMLIRIGQEVQTASKMLDDLLVWSSQQMRSEELVMEDITFKNIVAECGELFADRLKLKELRLQVLLDPPITVKGDLKRFEFIVRNILNNALKFSFIGQQITITQEDNDNEVVLAIHDQGVGMDEEKIERLKRKDLQESYQGTLDEKGAGIGLMLCHEFANRMGWTIQIVSTPGLGSTFSIHIPKIQLTT